MQSRTGLAVLLPSRVTCLISSLALFSVGFSLWMRIVCRGPYYPGWDVLGPAHGLFLVSTRSFWDAVVSVFHSTRHFQYWNHTNSLLYTLIPGYLGALWPWEYWAHLLTFALFMLTLWLVARVVDLPIRRSWILLLAWGASPAMLSFSVAGYPYITGLLPHALALFATIFSYPGANAGIVLHPNSVTIESIYAGIVNVGT